MPDLNFIIDVDGVMTSGQFLYSKEGKEYKIFGPHDADGLKMIKDKINIYFVTADKRGFPISEKRIDDLGFSIELISENQRYTTVKSKFGLENTIYMGDGIYDAQILRECKFGITPKNARKEAIAAASFVTPSNAAEGAVCDACLEIDKRFLSKDALEYKVCILTAGAGRRMENFTKHFNKAFLPVRGKPIISHIIEKIPEQTEIVIALGYQKDALQTYLSTAYPNRSLTFVNVDRYEGEGTGPGYSLLQCSSLLQCPFVYESVDTLFLEAIPSPTHNWFGVAPVLNTERFCSAKVESGRITEINDKTQSANQLAFIGLAGVKDYMLFWNALEKNKQTINGELQVSNGFSALIQNGLYPREFTWFDTGTEASYLHTKTNYPHGPAYRGEAYE